MSYADYLGILVGHGYACEVGAHDGLFQSITLPLEQVGWRVLCVEGNPSMKDSLYTHRREVLTVACGAQDVDEVPFYINTTKPESYTGLLQHRDCNETVMVPQWTLTKCLDHVKYPQLDLLAIDVEGSELAVLRGLDFTRWQPRVIMAENWGAPGDNGVQQFLLEHEYAMDGKIQYDEVFVRAK